MSKTGPRACLAAFVSFFIALTLGPCCIGWLRKRFREPIIGDSPRLQTLHRCKQSTPTMGGLFLLIGIVGSLLAFADLSNRYLLIAAVLAAGLGAVGAVDDLAKLRGQGNRRGLSVREKLFAQLLVSFPICLLVYQEHAFTPDALGLPLPLIGEVNLGLWFVPLAVLVIVGSSNAVNLTDGLDGLAGGCLALAVGAMAVATYGGTHAGWAQYLGAARVPQASEMLVAAGAMLGAVLGFLKFNCHPAQVFMGDTGSLPLGGLLGLLAVVARQEFLLFVVGGVFVVEALSVIIQVAWFRFTGKRVFRCAPLHHHFEFLGWPEMRIVGRFWIAAALCAILGLSGAWVLSCGCADLAGIKTAGEAQALRQNQISLAGSGECRQ